MADIEVGSVDASQVLTSTIWPTGSHVRLLNVPWDAAYRDVVAWESAAARDTWFAKQSGSWFASNFQNLRPGEPIDVPVPYSSVYQYNYIVITNPQQPVEYEGPERSYFYFITNAQYLSPQATRLTVQLDVMTTYAGGIEYGRAFVERGHVAIANENLRKGEITGRKLNVYLDNPEGLDVGSALMPGNRSYVPFTSDWDGTGMKHTWVIVVSTTDLSSDPGSVDKPALQTSYGGVVDSLPGGCTPYLMTLYSLIMFMKVAANYSWVTQGIIAIYSFPDKFLDSEGISKLPKTQLLGGKTRSISEFVCYSGGGLETTFSWRNGKDRHVVDTVDDVYGKIQSALGSAYNDLLKFLVYPYTVIELSIFDGNPVYLKPQYIRGNKLTIESLCCALMPFAKVGVFVSNYGDTVDSSKVDVAQTDLSKAYTIPSGDFLDTALWMSDFPQYSLVNNNYYVAMASSANTRLYNYNSAGWTNTKANMVAQNAYNKAMMWADTQQEAGVNTAATQAENANRTYETSYAVNQRTQLGNLGASVLTSGLSLKTGAKALQSTIGYVNEQSMAATTQSNALSMASTNAANASLYGTAGRTAAQNDYNTALATNMGDYQNQIAAINATVQDMALTPPSTLGQAGGNGFNWSNGLVGMMVTIKTVSGSAKRAIADYWRRYGYSIRRYMNLGSVYQMLCMSKFAYWKVLESNITCASANETEREAMRGVMEKGVTLWATPELIGTTVLTDNQPKDGYSY